MGNDGSSIPIPPLTTSLSDDLITSFDGIQPQVDDSEKNSTDFVTDWAAPQPQASARSMESSLLDDQASKQACMNDNSGTFTNQHYRHKLNAHHSALLQHWLPQIGGGAGGAPAGLGGPGQRSSGGSHSSPTVPLSQASRSGPTKRPSELTIQERRRLSRRAHATGEGLKPMSSLTDIVTTQEGVSSTSSDSDNVPGSSISNPTPDANTISSDFVKRAYSSTGFDLLGVLLKVMTRPKPKIEIGPVDLSCSFTVSDARHPDQPIVHCSDTFCQLTGYDRSEVLGRNCRFLQSPTGHVEAGSERHETDNGAVQHIKKNLSRNKECQVSLINYKKNGFPFINLVTIVPITWADSPETVFFVGFQVDLVEQPGAIVQRKPSGLYVVNYSQPNVMPSLHVLNNTTHDQHAPLPLSDPGESQASKEAILASELADMISNDSDDSSRWARMLLEHSHDLIHVLSLKGTFLYVSPSVERILGYKPDELVGKSISEFCHPSDVVPVFRELKDSTSNASIAASVRHWARVDGTANPPTKGGAGQTGPQVNLIMRMKHKNHGYEWIENVGKLHLEQGKGRKVVISTGRKRPIYNLPWMQARRSLNSHAPGFWSKVSTSGLILATSGMASDVLEPNTQTHPLAPLVGSHLKDWMNSEALGAFLSALRSLQVSAIPHMMSHGMQSEPQAVISTVIPSSAGGAGLPTVFMYTQRAEPHDFINLHQNAVYSQEAATATQASAQASALLPGEPAPGSVFGELSTFRSSSWVFELHQLKNANRRLHEEIRSQKRRASAGRNASQIQHLSDSKHSAQTKPASGPAPKFLSATKQSNSHGSSGTDPSLSPTPFSGVEGNGSSSEATSVEAGSENVAAGVKRSRS